ncbi:hypothetical protein [Pseudovibrio sp. Tun.PSC04-5.I4]|uniref:hypothetical protein n=1 Tax=Pseudovibrio sp. Tun.PSC04-5.I4 TaxID=1798213 RepID=UPI00088A63D7|nr:hypothetical protein [Pseudovibrio sp. Tun.PSC04-5.I4]SDQ93230.1 hypothetical protein SAMN04515695_1945 [Pseudovibrio sp. Tun.PSC04-5.I4]
MVCQYKILHRAVGAIDAQDEGRELRANAIVVMRPAAAPPSYEILYAPLTLKQMSIGMYVGTTPHGEVRLRLSGIYGAKRPVIKSDQPYLLLLAASGRNARIDELKAQPKPGQ